MEQEALMQAHDEGKSTQDPKAGEERREMKTRSAEQNEFFHFFACAFGGFRAC